MVEITLKELLENGVYFGHPSRQFDPRIKPFLYGRRQGIYIIDIERTAEKIREAASFLKSVVLEGKKVLFVGTKKQAQAAVQEIAEKCRMPYVNYRWIGGTLTNFNVIRQRIGRLDEIEALEASGRLSSYTKKEASLILKEKENLLRKFGGIRKLDTFPGALVIVDLRREANALKEAKKVGVPIVGIVDTNGNPELADYPIPANDDGQKSIWLVLSKLAEAISEVLVEARIAEQVKQEVTDGQEMADSSGERKQS